MDRRTDTCRWVRARAGLGSRRARGLFVCGRPPRDPPNLPFVCWGQRGGRALGAEGSAGAEPGARGFAARGVSEGTVPAPASSSRAGGREGGGTVCRASCRVLRCSGALPGWLGCREAPGGACGVCEGTCGASLPYLLFLTEEGFLPKAPPSLRLRTVICVCYQIDRES